MRLAYVPTAVMPADLLTKSLCGLDHRGQCERIDF